MELHPSIPFRRPGFTSDLVHPTSNTSSITSVSAISVANILARVDSPLKLTAELDRPPRSTIAMSAQAKFDKAGAWGKAIRLDRHT